MYSNSNNILILARSQFLNHAKFLCGLILWYYLFSELILLYPLWYISPSSKPYMFVLTIFWSQLVIWLVIPAATNGTANHANSTLALIVLVQYIPRSFIIFPLNQRIIKTTGFIAKTAWAGAAYNLLLYILASHVSFLCFSLLFFSLSC